MSLLTPSESLAFNGFLSAVSSVDYGDVIEWGALPSTLSEHIPPARGREALSKATKDLMTLEALHDNSIKSPLTTRPSPVSPSNPPNWPSFITEPSPLSRALTLSTATADQRTSQLQNYTYGFPLPRGHSGSASRPVNPYNTDVAPSPSHLPLSFPHPHSESSLRHRPLSLSPSSPYGLPTIPDNNLQQPQPHTPTFTPSRPPAVSSNSAPSVLLHRTVSASAVPTLSKRPFPSDGNDFDIVAKRRRSVTNPTSNDIKPSLSIPHRPPSSSSSSISATPTSQYPDYSPTVTSFNPSRASPVTPRSAQPIAPLPSRQALLSPSQKRANHIQSEQKRRANIRRGYEALCEVVPSLREAIRLEEAGMGRATSIGADDKPLSKPPVSQMGKVVSKKKKKGKAGSDEGEKPIDGRAGPRSENVVLSKTIAYIQTLLDERTNLTHRLTYACTALSHSSLNNHHQILQVSQTRLDDKGVPLWEREWGGGTGWAEISGCDGEDAEGEGDEDDGE